MKLVIQLLSVFCIFMAIEARAQSQPMAQTPAEEAKKMLGSLPIMFTYLPEAELQPAWNEFKTLQLSSTTAIPPKYKELIGVAVASQIPCHYCSYFHTQAAMQLHQSTAAEVKEAIAVAALTRKWSTMLNGIPQDPASFRRDLDRMFKPMGTRQTRRQPTGGSVSGATTAPEAELPMAKSAQDVYRQAEKMWGFVPQFIKVYPKHSVASAWNQFKTIEMGQTSIPSKYKSMISLAVASQVPCGYCVQMDTRSAMSSGAKSDETAEAVAIAANTRHWSTILNGNLVKDADFKNNTDQIISFVKASAASKDTTSSTTTEGEESSEQSQ